MRGTLNAGDMLYSAIFWRRQTLARELSISVSAFIHTGSEMSRAGKAAT